MWTQKETNVKNASGTWTCMRVLLALHFIPFRRVARALHFCIFPLGLTLPKMCIFRDAYIFLTTSVSRFVLDSPPHEQRCTLNLHSFPSHQKTRCAHSVPLWPDSAVFLRDPVLIPAYVRAWRRQVPPSRNYSTRDLQFTHTALGDNYVNCVYPSYLSSLWITDS